jgi:hypothetical protein
MHERHSGIQGGTTAIDSAGRGPLRTEAPAEVDLGHQDTNGSSKSARPRVVSVGTSVPAASPRDIPASTEALYRCTGRQNAARPCHRNHGRPNQGIDHVPTKGWTRPDQGRQRPDLRIDSRSGESMGAQPKDRVTGPKDRCAVLERRDMCQHVTNWHFYGPPGSGR